MRDTDARATFLKYFAPCSHHNLCLIWINPFLAHFDPHPQWGPSRCWINCEIVVSGLEIKGEMETVCHQHTDLRVKIPSFSPSYLMRAQTGGWLPDPAAGVGRALPLCHSPGDSMRGFPLRNRAWSGGATNTVFNATWAPNSLPVSHMGTTFVCFETRPVYIPSDLAFGACKIGLHFYCPFTLLFYELSFDVSSIEAHLPSSFTTL